MLLIYLCESSYFVSMNFLFFCQKGRFLSILLHSFLSFSVLFNKIFIKSICLLGMNQNLCEFAQRTLFLNFNTKHTTTVIFLFLIFPLKLFIWRFLLIFFYVSAKFWSMSHHESVGRVQNKIKNTLIYFKGVFFGSFCCFS